MKKLVSLILIILLLPGCTRQENIPEASTKTEIEEIRGVWLFYRELSMVDEKGGTAESFTEKINTIFDKCVSLGINTVFFHVRPSADSFYASKIFPFSEYLTGKQGGAVDYDPLKIAVSLAHEKNISLHAWINPFRISFSSDKSELAETNPAVKLINENSDRICTVNGGLYFNPASEENRKLIIDGVREIVNSYDVDGVHIDDYFYPDTDKSIDEKQFQDYVSCGGNLSLEEWRTQNVNTFVSNMYSAVKSCDENVIVSVSPAGNIENNYKKLYADVKRWGSTEGYCDWLIPQIYFGFENSAQPYETVMNEWRKNTICPSVRLAAGLAAYKVLSGESDEWKKGGIIGRQWGRAEENGYDGFVLFSYSSIISEKFSGNDGFLTERR